MAQIRKEVMETVVSALQEFCPASGEEITEDTNPLLELGLTSADGVELACALSERLPHYFPVDQNPLIDESKHSPRTVGQLTDYLCFLLSQGSLF